MLNTGMICSSGSGVMSEREPIVTFKLVLLLLQIRRIVMNYL